MSTISIEPASDTFHLKLKTSIAAREISLFKLYVQTAYHSKHRKNVPLDMWRL